MLKRQIRGVIFDMDGTLVDSLASTFNGFNHAVESCGGKRLTPHEIMEHFGRGEDEIFARILGPAKAAQAYERFRQYVDDNMANVPLHSGIADLLESLKSAGFPLSIVTGRSWITTELILRHHRLLDRFLTVIAADHVAANKPSPEGIELALSRMRLGAEDTVYVGDTWMDMRAAQLAQTSGVAALWDLLASREEMAKHGPRHYAEHPRHVLEFIRGLEG